MNYIKGVKLVRNLVTLVGGILVAIIFIGQLIDVTIPLSLGKVLLFTLFINCICCVMLEEYDEVSYNLLAILLTIIAFVVN